MKRILLLLLAASITLSFSACSSLQKNASVPAKQDFTVTDNPVAKSGSKVLVVYFSSANSTQADSKSYATPYFDGVASTEYLANAIAGKTGADIAKLTPVNDYPSGYASVVSHAKKEADSNARPEFVALEVNPEDYDIIFIGYPVWWYTMPMVIYTFFDLYSFSGKTVIPFNTHEGSHDGGTYLTIQQLEPEAAVKNGFNVNGRETDKALNELDLWLNGLDI